MTFEETLCAATEAYAALRREDGVTLSAIAMLFQNYFPSLGARDNRDDYWLAHGSRNVPTHTFELPGPLLARDAQTPSPHWVRQRGSLSEWNEQVETRLARYPEGTGNDGLIHLAYVADATEELGTLRIYFQPYLPIPRVTKACDMSTPVLQSSFGTLSLHASGNSYQFCRSPRGDETESAVPVLPLGCSSFQPERIAYLALTLGGLSIEPVSDTHPAALLGDGSVDAFLKHMQYDCLDGLVRERAFR